MSGRKLSLFFIDFLKVRGAGRKQGGWQEPQDHNVWCVSKEVRTQKRN